MTINESVRKGALTSSAAGAITVADYERLFDGMGRGFCIIQLMYDEAGRPYDALYVTANAAFEEHTGIANPTGRTIKQDIPGLEQHWFDFYSNVALSRQANSIENGSESMGRWFDVYAVPFGEPTERMVAVFFTDISARKRAEASAAAAEMELRRSEQRSHLAVTMAHLGTWWFSVEDQTVRFDERMCEIWGRPASQPEVSLPDTLNAIHEDDRRRAALQLAAALDPTSAGAFEVEARVVRSDGSIRWILANGQAQVVGIGATRRTRHLIGTALDVTERREAEEALRANESRLKRELADARTLQSLSSAFMAEGKSEGLYENILTAAIALMRSDMASIQMLVPDRKELRLLASRGFHPDAAAYWQWVGAASGSTCGMALAANQRVHVYDIEAPDSGVKADDLQHYRLCGIRSVQSTPLISRSGELLGMISTHWRTPHEPAERELSLLDVVARQASDALERRASEAELLRALAAKDEFLGLVSHELRTPITTVLGNANVLVRLGDELDANARATALTDIRDHADRLSRIVDDLLALARAERGVLESEPIALGHAVRRIVADYGADARVHVALSGDEAPLIVDGENGMLSQIMRNFISNAERYGMGSTIEVKIARHGGEAAVCVMDRGIGIKMEETERIFDPFYRSADVRAIGGLGIGLSVCKRLAEAVGGRVWATPREGGGSEFGLALPLHDADSSVGTEASAP